MKAAQRHHMNWKACWIWHPPTANMDNFYMCARRKFTVKKTVTRAKICCSADHAYKLYVNGKFIGRGPSPADAAWYYYDEYDVTKHLAKGTMDDAAGSQILNPEF